MLFVDLILKLNPDIVDLSVEICCGFEISKRDLKRMAGLNITKISIHFKDEFENQRCKELPLFPNLQVVISEKDITASRDLIYTLPIKEIVVDVEKEKNCT